MEGGEDEVEEGGDEEEEEEEVDEKGALETPTLPERTITSEAAGLDVE